MILSGSGASSFAWGISMSLFIGKYWPFMLSANVKSERISNGKQKGKNNNKNGNKYLAWAYVEAANFANRFSLEAQKFYQRKKAKRNNIVATKALSNKICRASYYIMRDHIPFDEARLFG